MAGERILSRWFDVDAPAAGGRGKWTNGPSHNWPFNRDYGTAAMYEAGKILYAGGGGNLGWQSPDAKTGAPTATAEKIDLNAATPSWTTAGSMALPRRHLNSTILPDGTVLITGGTTGGGFVDINTADAAKTAELWDPKNPTQWTTLAANSKMRVYHSVSLLLPDGTVLHGASGNALAGTSIVPDEKNHEIFSPPYLFKGVRPTITSAPASVSYGQSFSVSTPNAAQITDVRWIRIGSVTHAFDAGQRANTLVFSRTATGVDVTVPASPNLAPPGHYLLFVLNRNGVPSVAKFVQLLP
jgi:galactose oxidase